MTAEQKKDILKSIIVLTVICLVISGLLAFVNSFTSPVSKANAVLREDSARKELIPQAAFFREVSQDRLPEGINTAYLGYDEEDSLLGMVFTVSGKGFGGNISVMCAIGQDGRILNCRAIDVSGETKTLGGRTQEASYTDMFVGKDSGLDGVDTISGATVTSVAFEDCVHRAFDAWNILTEVI